MRLVRHGLSMLVSGLAMGVGLGIGLQLSTPAGSASAAAPLVSLPADFTGVSRRAQTAVVNISAIQVVRSERSPFFSDPFFRDFFGRDHPFRVPQEERKLSLGSGVIVSRDGVIVTNHHVIQQARQIEVSTHDRKRVRATLVGSDPVTDIAVIRMSSAGPDTLPWGDSSRAQVGEYVLAVGNPFRLNQTVTMGIISAVGRSNVGIVDYEDFIQTDAAINPGNSGGALVNIRGELIGINTAIYSETGGYQGIGFAVPSNLARRVVTDLLEHGRVVRGWVGITQLKDVDETTARGLGLKTAEGVLVVELIRGSPADRAGLLPGDVVISLDDRPVRDAPQLRNELAAAHVGAELRLGVLRQGQRHEVRIRVEGAPSGV